MKEEFFDPDKDMNSIMTTKRKRKNKGTRKEYNHHTAGTIKLNRLSHLKYKRKHS